MVQKIIGFLILMAAFWVKEDMYALFWILGIAGVTIMFWNDRKGLE